MVSNESSQNTYRPVLTRRPLELVLWPHLLGHRDQTEGPPLTGAGDIVTALTAEGLWMLADGIPLSENSC